MNKPRPRGGLANMRLVSLMAVLYIFMYKSQKIVLVQVFFLRKMLGTQ